MMTSCVQPVTLNEIKRAYCDPDFAAGRDMTVRPDGKIEIDFAFWDRDDDSVLKVLLPPAKEWGWNLDGIPLDPMMLSCEVYRLKETHIMQYLPAKMRGVEVDYLFGRLEEGDNRQSCWFQVDPERIEQATHVLLQIHYDTNQATPVDFNRMARLRYGICWEREKKYEWGNLELMCYCLKKRDKDLSTKWYICKIPKKLEPARQYWANEWKGYIQDGREAFEIFLQNKQYYKERMAKFLSRLPDGWTFSMDGKGDGQFLMIEHYMQCDDKTHVLQHFFRYDERGEEALKNFYGLTR